MESLIGPAVVIDVSEKALQDRDYQIAVEDLATWEAKHGAIPQNSIVLFRTGYGRHWPNPERYLGTGKRGVEAIAELHFPGLGPDAARWIVRSRAISAVGIDTASIDFGQSQMFESHRILLGENVPVLENLAKLEQLPETGALVVALPMEIKGGSGGPVRIAALIPK